MSLNEIKKQASSFLQEKYKTARLALTDVTQAQLLTEEAINGEQWGPNARTMTRICDAAFDMDDYCRIVDVLHRRLSAVNYKEWRQVYKTLVLLEFLLTHGPEDMFEEFHCDIKTIQELQKFNYLDERGFNWGACMQTKSETISKLLTDEEQFKAARAKALKISKEIQGFGNLIVSPSSSSSASTPSFRTSRISFGSSFTDSPSSNSVQSPTWTNDSEMNEPVQQHRVANNPFEGLHQGLPRRSPDAPVLRKEMQELHLWGTPIEENGSLIEPTNEDVHQHSWRSRLYSRLLRTPSQGKRDKNVNFRSLSDVGKTTNRKLAGNGPQDF